ncbi:hypothetical protein ELG65_02650 [Rhizobium leguminosarum]|nr:hypothetical protein ELG85_02710 [Rhizobium leguminosarum]TBG66862.1 hypothetical protein ELG74_02815 [Rhizobium leguminosarum]TBH10151.1 hypothetical protein ELG68_02755 [Rhizobium leguminosarum]TBH57389.1 hypothetical protein ELG65_02650 [Rhizobium leguminosarum]
MLTIFETGRRSFFLHWDWGRRRGCGLLFALGIGLWTFGLFGAGDAKLFLPIGLFIGWNSMLPFAICSVGRTPFLKPRPSARTNTQTARRSGFDAAFEQLRHKAPRRERA